MTSSAHDDEQHTKSVGIWIRVSTEDQAQGESPQHHEQRARYYAEAKGWNVREVYHLEGVSGKSVQDHPETKRMQEDVTTGRITGLIFSKLARLARSTRQLLDFADFFHEHDADLISLDEAIDTTSPAGRLFYTMIAAMAQWEREEIAARMTASVKVRASLGKNLGGQAPFGYQWLDGELMPEPTEAPVRKLMYELFQEHRRKKTVARLLNEAGHRTRKGARFSDTTVDRLLKDPTAKGLRRLNYTQGRDGTKRWTLKPEDEWVWFPVEPIVSEELWDACNRIIEEQHRSRRPPGKKTAHLFSGFAFCTCGTKMYVPSNTPKYVCQSCRNKIPIVDLEGVFQEQLKNFVFSPDEVAKYLQEVDHTIQQQEELLESLESQRREVQQEMDRIYRLHMDAEVMPEGFGRRYKPLEQRLYQLEEEIPRLRGHVDFLKVQYLSSDEILSEARDLYGQWSTLTFSQKRKIVENITEKIVIDTDEVTIHLCYLPPSSLQQRTPSSAQNQQNPSSPQTQQNPHPSKELTNSPRNLRRSATNRRRSPTGTA